MKTKRIEVLEYTINDQYLLFELALKNNNYKLGLIARDGHKIYPIKSVSNNDGELQIDLSDLMKIIPIEYGRFDFFIEDDNNIKYYLVLKNFRDTEIWKRYFYQHYIDKESPLYINLYISLQGNFSLVIRNKHYVDATERNYLYYHEITDIHSKGNKLRLSVNIKMKNANNMKINSVVLKLQSNEKNILEEGTIEDRSYFCDEMKLNIVFAHIDQTLEEPLNYSMYIEFEENGIKINLPINFVSKLLYNKMKNLKKPILMKIDNSKKVIEVVMSKDGYIRYVCREKTKLDSTSSKIKIIISNLMSCFYKIKNPILFIYEKNAMTAQDNGFSFFKYMYNNYDNRNFYYIINKNSPQLKTTLKYKRNVIYQYSLKYFFYLMHSRYLMISSESRMHLVGSNQYTGVINNQLRKRKHLFLQHGIIAAKKVPMFKKNTNGETDVFCVSSEEEKTIVTKKLGYNESEVIITGLSRWDEMNNQPNPNLVLYMPTWRSWMEDIGTDGFLQSNFYQNIDMFINDKNLIEFLELQSINLVICLHPKFNRFSIEFHSKSKNVKIARQNDFKINELVNKASILISDYSSIMWDFAYLEKPVILYQFDQSEYLKNTGSYVDLNKEFLANIVINKEDAIRTLKNLLFNDQKEKQNYTLNSKKWFFYKDKNNSKRILEFIEGHYSELMEYKNEVPYESIKLSYLKKLITKRDIINQNQNKHGKIATKELWN